MKPGGISPLVIISDDYDPDPDPKSQILSSPIISPNIPNKPSFRSAGPRSLSSLVPKSNASTGVRSNMTALKRTAAETPSPEFRKKAKNNSLGYSGTLVVILIGPKENPKEFSIHKDIACHHSSKFDAVFNDPNHDGEPQEYSLENTSEETFLFFLQWIYGKNLEPRNTWTTEGPRSITDVSEVRALTKLWILAEELGMPRLQNASILKIDEHMQKSNYSFNITADNVFHSTSTETLLHRFFVARKEFWCKGETHSASNIPTGHSQRQHQPLDADGHQPKGRSPEVTRSP